MISEALTLFKGNFPFKRRVNCAVAIGTVFKRLCPLTEDILQSMNNMGHGKAPGKVCGAYHAARTMVMENNPALLDQLDSYFTENTGSLICREIKKNKVSCERCVELAARFLQQNCPAQKA